MIAVTKTICILTCGFVLSVGLSQTTWAGDEMKSPVLLHALADNLDSPMISSHNTKMDLAK